MANKHSSGKNKTLQWWMSPKADQYGQWWFGYQKVRLVRIPNQQQEKKNISV